MTCREKLKQERPDLVSDRWICGCFGCPIDFGYLKTPSWCIGEFADEKLCSKCWDREIPEEKYEPPHVTFDDIVNNAKRNEILKEQDLANRGGIIFERGQSKKDPEERNVIQKAWDAVNQPAILDSGDRTEFPTGAVRDMREGKGRMDLLPWAAIMEVSKHCENGANKYGEHNVDKGIPTNSLCDSAARHLAKYLDGWTDEPHLLAAIWNLLWALQMEIKHPELVNTPWKE